MQFNIADLFESVVSVAGEREALVCGERRLSYAELDARANRLAHYLASQGIAAGDHVGMYMYNCAEFLEIMLACFKIRAIPINVNYRYVADELRYMFDNADLVGLFYNREFTPLVADAAAGFPALQHFVYIDDDSGKEAECLAAVSIEEAMACASPEREFAERSGDDLYIIYTGGTTGMPKGVMWRHTDLFFAGLQGGNPGGQPITRPEELAELVEGNDSPMATLPVAPFIHGAAQWGALIGLFGGGKVVVQPGRSMRPELIWELVEAERVAIMTIVGDAMASPLADVLERPGAAYDLSSLIVIGSAGAIFSESVKERLRSKLGSTMFIDSFGSTESGHTGSMTLARSQSDSGHPCFSVADNVTVVDEDLRRLEPGSGVVGMLARKGHLPVGYYNDPEKTAKTFVEIDGERWVIPGDLATLENDGTVTVYGRGAVCINSGGEKIFPEEVEEVLKAHPSVADVLVVGVPDPRWGQKVAAVVRVRDGTRASAEELEIHCRQHVAGYKVPRLFCMVADVARQPSGKPDYKWAREVASGQTSG